MTRMDTDPFIARLGGVDRTCLELVDVLASLRAALAEVQRMRAQGRPVSEIVALGPAAAARRDVRAAWLRVNRALHEYRVQIVKSMVDGEGMSIAEVARVTGNARQVISRLYHSNRRSQTGPRARSA